MTGKFVTKIFGTKSGRTVKKLWKDVDKINDIFENLKDVPDDHFRKRTAEFKKLISERREEAIEEAQAEDLSAEEILEIEVKAKNEVLEEILHEAFAMVKEVCRRLLGESWSVVGQKIKWDMVPFDVQLVGALELHIGNIAEMKTGEGKTLAATMPLYLNALTGEGVHLITVNDYLAQRDSEWMGKIYERLGLTSGCMLNTMNNEQRRAEYAKDITYGTNNEFGFDYLRDNMAIQVEDQVQRSHSYAIVDEVDSVLIDEARTPLIISGQVEGASNDQFLELKPKVSSLVHAQSQLVDKLINDAKELLETDEYKAGEKILIARRGMPKHKKLLSLYEKEGIKRLEQQVENDYIRDKKLHELDEDLYYSIEEKNNVIDLNEKGRDHIAPNDLNAFVIPDIGTEYEKIENDESLDDLSKSQKKAEMQELFAAQSEKIHNISQLLKAYSLFEKDVEYVVTDGKVMIVDEFTGRILPGRRYSDGLHQAIEAKEGVRIEAQTQTIASITIQNYFRMYDKLAGMTGTAETEAGEFASIYDMEVTVIPTHEKVIREDNEDLIYKTRREKYKAVVEEIADCHERRQPVLVGTISVEVSELLGKMLTNRGIKHRVLNAKQHQNEAEIVAHAGEPGSVTIATNMAGRGTDIKLGEGVVEVGGLHIIGTERHESRRIDLQLRGRSGRQGDPGSTVFYMSLEDDLMRLFGSERIARIMDRLGLEEGEVITHSMITRSIERAQKKVEMRNFGIRKHLLEYDDVMNKQREIIYDRRNKALKGGDMKAQVMERLKEYIEDLVDAYTAESPHSDEWNWSGISGEAMSTVMVDLEELRNSDIPLTPEALEEELLERAKENYERKQKFLGPDMMRQLERFAVLRVIDEHWKNHLFDIDQVKEGINLRAYGQKNPLLEYKKEAFELFLDMLEEINKNTVRTVFRFTPAAQMGPVDVLHARNVQTTHDEAMGMGFAGAPVGSDGNGGGQAANVSPDGRHASRSGKQAPVVAGVKIGRNDPCPCGSGKKYKKCHGA
ncbi:MAG: preprotein translocase subunit SecA [Candidatus Marinimicrobia bacterium]|nr:preprotein translocase subunit SecA [Candidatus Neomarinimicrobiota bacterium]